MITEQFGTIVFLCKTLLNVVFHKFNISNLKNDGVMPNELVRNILNILFYDDTHVNRIGPYIFLCKKAFPLNKYSLKLRDCNNINCNKHLLFMTNFLYALDFVMKNKEYF